MGRNGMLRDKLKFVIKALTDKDAAYILAAYNTMKQRCAMLNGVGMGDAGKMKAQLIKRLCNTGYNLQVMGINAVREFLEFDRHREELERLERERQQKEKDRILRRIMDSNLRFLGIAFRQAEQYTQWAAEAERMLMYKQRGIMRRIVDSNVRLMGAGWNKLIESWKHQQGMLKDKLRFVIKTLTDKDAAFKLMAYNQMKQRWNMLNGVGLGDAEKAKTQLIKRLTNQGYNLQVMGVNCIREFLTSERDREEQERLEFERQQKEKDRILRRIMDSNVRFMGMGFRQAGQWTQAEIERERIRMMRQRGIMNRIVNSNVRLMSAGYNKLLEEWKARQNNLKEKLKFVIKTLTDKDAQMSMMAYNGLKQRALMLAGVGMGDGQMKKIALIKRLTNQGFNLQAMAVNQLLDFLESEREREQAERLEYERQQKEKDRILRRIMDSNVRFMGMGFRQANQWALAEA